jgi:YD repeat-containing protein
MRRCSGSEYRDVPMTSGSRAERGSASTATSINTHYAYDPNGNLAEILDPSGGVTGFQYDDADRLEQCVLPNGVVTTYSCDDSDSVLSVVHRNARNVVLASVDYIRSPSGEPIEITREDGTYVTPAYDAALLLPQGQAPVGDRDPARSMVGRSTWTEMRWGASSASGTPRVRQSAMGTTRRVI